MKLSDLRVYPSQQEGQSLSLKGSIEPYLAIAGWGFVLLLLSEVALFATAIPPSTARLAATFGMGLGSGLLAWGSYRIWQMLRSQVFSGSRWDASQPESESRYRLLFDSSSEAILVQGLTETGELSRFLDVNDVACRTLGYPRDQLLQRSLLEISDAEFGEGVPAIARRLLTEETLHYEQVMLSQDGRRILVEVRAHRVRFEGKAALLLVVRDLTERQQEWQETLDTLRRTRDELDRRVGERTAELVRINQSLQAEIAEREKAQTAWRESERRLQDILEHSPTLIFLKDLQGRYLIGNRRWQAHCGRALGKTDGELFPLETASWFVVQDEKVLASEQPHSYEETVALGEQVHTYLTIKFPVYDTSGVLYGIGGISTEISDYKQVQEALRLSEERFRIALQNSPTVVFCQNREFRYTWIYNPALGYEAQEVVGKLDSDIFLLEDSKRLNAIKRRALVTGKGTREQTSVTFRGEVRYYDLTVEPSRNSDGEIVGVTCAATDITEVQAQRKQLRAIFEAVLDAIAIVDNNGIFIEANPAACQLLGLPHTQLLGRPWMDFVESGFDGEQVWREFRAQGQATGEICLRCPDGTLRDIECAARADFLPGRHLAVMRDITARKQAEAARQKTEKLYRTLASNFPNGIVALFDRELRYTLTEGRELGVLGLSKTALEGKTLWEAFPPDVCAVKEQAYRTALAGKPATCEFPLADQYYSMHVLPVRNERGEIYAGMSMSQNISDRKRTELALLRERNFVSTILDTANALIVVLDAEGKIVRFNRACERLTGYAFPQVEGRCIWDFFIPSEAVESAKRVFESLRSQQGLNEYENRWLMRDGTPRLLSWSNAVLQDEDGTVKYVIGIGIDITERQQAEAMRRALEREQELSALRLRFFSMVSHEFRTPLSTILFTVQLLNTSEEGSATKPKRHLQRIESAVKHLTRMLDDVLTINRAETGKLEFNPQPLDLEKFCRHLLEEMQLQSPQELRLCVEESGERAVMDKMLLHSILSNLLANGIKYSPQGGEVELTLRCDRTQAIFQVRDRGIGIPPSDLPHLFEAFRRGSNIETIPGTGLGLTVVKKCVDLHRGSITVASELERGTTFTVTLPLQP